MSLTPLVSLTLNTQHQYDDTNFCDKFALLVEMKHESTMKFFVVDVLAVVVVVVVPNSRSRKIICGGFCFIFCVCFKCNSSVSDLPWSSHSLMQLLCSLQTAVTAVEISNINIFMFLFIQETSRDRQRLKIQ